VTVSAEHRTHGRAIALVARLALAVAPLGAAAPLGAQAAVTPVSRAVGAAFVPLRADAGAPLDALVTVNAAGRPLAAVVDEVARQAGISIVFDPTLPGLERPATLRATRVAAAAALVRLLDQTPVRALVSPSGGVVLLAREATRGGAVHGLVRDSTTGAPVAGARVELLGTRFAAATRDDGRFAFPAVPAGEYRVRVAQIGYRPAVLGPVRVGEGPLPSIDVTLGRAATPLSAVTP
jgi:hypothetical protein